MDRRAKRIAPFWLFNIASKELSYIMYIYSRFQYWHNKKEQ